MHAYTHPVFYSLIKQWCKSSQSWFDSFRKNLRGGTWLFLNLLAVLGFPTQNNEIQSKLPIRTKRPPKWTNLCLLTCPLTVYPQLIQKAKQPEWSSWEQPSKFLENDFQLQLRYTKWNEAFTVYQSSRNICSTAQYLIPVEVFPWLQTLLILVIFVDLSNCLDPRPPTLDTITAVTGR